MLSPDNSPFTLQKADRTLSLKSQSRFKLQSYKVSRTSGFVRPCTRFGNRLVPRRRASRSDLSVLIETITTSPFEILVHLGPA
jgi:hypothetical protein